MAVLPRRDLADAGNRDLRIEVAPEVLLQQPLLLREPEVHRYPLGSRGMPRPRSEMMFFWIWAVPPPMMSPSENM